MFKKALGIIAIAALLHSCGTKQSETENTAEKISVDNLMASIDNHIDKDMLVCGTVSHVCSHGGKRLFLIGENPDNAIKVIPNDEIGVFSKELEGSFVHVYGKVQELKIDEAYISNMENEMAEGIESEAAHTHDGTHDEEHKHAGLDSTQIQKIAEMRQEVADSEKGYISQYWIEATKIETTECAEKTDKEHKCSHEKEEKAVEAEK